MPKKKVIDLLNYKIRQNLKANNRMVEGQKEALKLWQKIRRAQPRVASNPETKKIMMDLVGLKPDIVGSKGKKALKDLKKWQKRGGFALRSSEKRERGRAIVGKGKDAHQILRALTSNIKDRAKSLPQWKASGAKKEFILEQQAKQKMYKEAKSGLQNRMINMRGKGVRFIRKNGRIIPIRPKRKR